MAGLRDAMSDLAETIRRVFKPPPCHGAAMGFASLGSRQVPPLEARALPGFEAYRYAVLRVPGLWWQIPLFYVPVFSRLLGHPIYNWVAGNRGWLSSFLLRSRRS